MEQQIRFCTSGDGTRIAYATYGETAARTLVVVPVFPNAQETGWNHPATRAFNETLASGRRLVTFDRRGVGGSQRDVADLAIPAQVADLAAVIDQLGLTSFDLMTWGDGGALAAAYAAEHPERVGRLVFWHPLVSTSDSPLRAFQDMAQSIRGNWSLARRSWAAIAYPNGPTDQQRWFSNMLRDSLAPELAARHFEVIAEFDGGAILRTVQAPTLVLAILGAPHIEIASVRAVASLIPDARLVTLEGDWGTLTVDPSQVLTAIRNFLDEAEAESEAVESQPAPGGLVTILFTDMESSTALTQRLGDAKAQELVRAHNTIVRDALKTHGGSEIKHTGDGIMASFLTASGALECAIAIQRAVEGQADTPLRVRIGLNAGEPVAEEQDLFGASVQLAKRVCDHAEPGQIVASNVVRELAAGKGFLFSDLGDVVPKGFEDPVRLYEVRWRNDAAESS